MGKVEPNLVLWLSAAALVVVGIGATRQLRSHWTGGESARRAQAVFAFFGEPMASAMASSVPLAGPASLVFGLIGLVLLAREVTSGTVQQVMGVVGSILVPPMIIAVVLAFSIMLFGRPKFLIPPHLRKHRGFLGEHIRSAASAIGAGRTRRQ